MATDARHKKSRVLRAVIVAVFSVLLIGGYLWAIPGPPGRDAERQLDGTSGHSAESGLDDEDRVDVVNVTPSRPAPGGVIVVDHSFMEEAAVSVYLGKQPLQVLSQRPGTMVARLPSDAAVGRVKIRVGTKGHRSKPYDVHIAPRDWRLPFSGFVGGIALIVFGTGAFARGAREAVGKAGADRLGRYSQRRTVAFFIGAAAGATSQSTVASAALISGLTASRLATAAAAATAFVGAQVGAGTLPLLTGGLDLLAGLVGIALGVFWLTLANDRRTSAWARLMLGAGFVTFGLHLLRSGLEPLVLDQTFLQLASGLRADGLTSRLLCLAVGVLLLLIFQGAASTLLVAAGLLQLVGALELPTLLYVMSGSGLGAALSALITTRWSERGRRLSQLHLLLGVVSTLVAFVTVEIWVELSALLAGSGGPLASFGSNVLAPSVGKQLALAFVFSQVFSALVALPFVSLFARWVKRATPKKTDEGATAGSVVSVRHGLVSVLRRQRWALELVSDLVLAGERGAGSHAEHALSEARSRLQSLLRGGVRQLPEAGPGAELRQSAFACLQLERSLEDLLYRAERFTDRQVGIAARGAAAMSAADLRIATEMHALLLEAVETVHKALIEEARVDLEIARRREIRLNALEAQTRRAALEASGDSRTIALRLEALELFDAYEGAGNHLYRLAETLGGGVFPHRAAAG